MKKLGYFLLILLIGIVTTGNLFAQAEQSKEKQEPATSKTDSPTPPNVDSLDLQTTEQPETDEGSEYDGNSKTVKPFTNIYVAGNYNVEIRQGDKHTVEVEHGPFRNPIYKVSGNTLKIGIHFPFEQFSRGTIYVTTPNLEVLKVSGSNYVKSDGMLEVDCLEIKGSGASKIDLEVKAQCIQLDHSGAVSTILEGNTKTLECRQTGASKLRASKLVAEKVELLITGAGSAHVNANNSLEIVGSGICKVRYEGEPEMISKRLSGPCRVVKM